MIEQTNDFIPFALEPSWQALLEEELQAPYMKQLALFVARERVTHPPIYPPESLMFNAFWKTPYSQVKVVILGQDPYHGPGQAHGLCFSVPKGVDLPPSLQNIFKEMKSDLGIPISKQGCLLPWTEQGVFLINNTLTVRQGSPMSHHGQGWEKFTDAVIAKLVLKKEPLVFVLWGKSAQKKCETILKESNHHLIIKSAHPSPLSAHQGFFGSKPFSKVNDFLEKNQILPINWSLD